MTNVTCIREPLNSVLSADWQAPAFYQELDLDKARLVVQFGDLAHLMLDQFEKAAKAYAKQDLSAAQFLRTGEAALVEIQTRAETMQWVVEMMSLPGNADEYALNSYPEDAAFLIVYAPLKGVGQQTFRCGGGSPGAALALFAEQFPERYRHVTKIFVDKRSLQPASIA